MKMAGRIGFLRAGSCRQCAADGACASTLIAFPPSIRVALMHDEVAGIDI
jgi:hypothetical protein